METTYEVIDSKDTKMIKRTTAEGVVSFIPMDETNSDYQAYLNTLASESQAAPTAQADQSDFGVSFPSQPLLGVGFSYLERGKANDTR